LSGVRYRNAAWQVTGIEPVIFVVVAIVAFAWILWRFMR